MAVDKLRRTLFSKFDALVHEAFANEESKLYGVVSNFVVLVIIYSIVGIIFESVVSLHTKYEAFFKISEYIVVGIFIAEYAGQVHVTRPRRKYIFGLWGIIDFLAIAPSLIQWLDLRQLKIARILRVMRFLRLMRIMKLAKTVTADYEKTKGKKSSTLKMDLQIYFITMFSVLVISSTLVFYAESGQVDTGFTNIPTSMWWGITTMTTVGYGDLTPETIAGRVVAGITALCGLALFAMLMNVVGKALMQGLFGHEDDEETGAVIDARSLLSVSERMDELVRLRDQELVTPDEFEAKRRELVETIWRDTSTDRPEENTVHVGCCAYSYRQYLTKGDMTLGQFLDLGVDMDLDGVELTSYYFPDTETSTLYDVKRMALRRGLEVSGAAVGNNFCQADPAKRAEHVQMVKDWIYNSVKLGAPLLRVFAGPVPDGSSEDDAREWTIASLQECAEVAAQEGVMLALENHGGITATVEQVEGLIAATDSDWVAVNLDTGNYRTDPYGSITRTVPMAITAHVKTEVPGPNGKEDVDIESVVNALSAGGYRGYLSIEYEASEDPMTAVPRFVETLQRLVR